MISTVNITRYIILSLPAYSSLICLIMYLYSYWGTNFEKNKQVSISLAGYFMTVFFNWIIIAIIMYSFQFQSALYPFRYASVLLTQVFFYRFIYHITRLPGDNPFSAWHYFFPISIAVIIYIWSLLIPAWALDEIIQSAGKQTEAYPVFSRLFNSLFQVRLIYDIIYITLSLKRIRRYRLEVGNYTSQLEPTYMGWLNILIVLVIVLIIGPAISAFASDRTPIATQWLFIPVIILMAQHILIVYNTLIHNFTILEDIPEEAAVSIESVEENEKLIKTIRKREFEKFLAEKRPYTNKELKITDLAKQLNSNRTYLSVFINNTYGLTFSSLMNERRLRYLEELRGNTAMKNKSNIELIHLAGFGSYQSYLRAKQKETKSSILKLNLP